MALFFALLSHIGWGVGDVFGVVATRRMGTIPMTVWRGIFAFILATMLLLPFFLEGFFAGDASAGRYNPWPEHPFTDC